MLRIQNKSLILTIIVVSQFLCTSLWFASNGIMEGLLTHFDLLQNTLGYLTSAVQLGFIAGTLVFAILSIADRFSPSKLFFVCALIGAMFNVGMVLTSNTLVSLIVFRFFTGFCLAGIYPIGMKIAADYFEKGLGKSLGFLVGALVLGTALPHILRDFFNEVPWQFIIKTTSALALAGGLLMFTCIADGPFRRRGTSFNASKVFSSFKNSAFKKAAFGYFGHMWELYAFWAFLPLILSKHNQNFPENTITVALWSFLIIAVGSIGCVVAGKLSSFFSTKKIANLCLSISLVCCLVSPIIIQQANIILLMTFLCVWGFFVIADSPLFSSLVAINTEASNKGTALTIVNCIGFSISIVSIQLLSYMIDLHYSPYVFMILAIGPIVSIFIILKSSKKEKQLTKKALF